MNYNLIWKCLCSFFLILVCKKPRFQNLLNILIDCTKYCEITLLSLFLKIELWNTHEEIYKQSYISYLSQEIYDNPKKLFSSTFSFSWQRFWVTAQNCLDLQSHNSHNIGLTHSLWNLMGRGRPKEKDHIQSTW